MALDRSYSEERDESIEKQALDWNPLGARSRGRTKQTWRKAVLEETGNEAKFGVRLRGSLAVESDGDASQMPCVPNGNKGYYNITTTTVLTSD